MPSPLRVLHLASFNGNIGDNANHMGFRPWFEAQVARTVDWTRLEIREFYWGERQWDGAFVELINRHDMLVVGGGNYFELWVEDSPTGTSFALAPDQFDRIKVPVFFNALGVDPGQGVPDASRTRFARFLDRLLSSDQYLVSVRNDGAKENLRRHIGQTYSERIHELPDHGFFVSSGDGLAQPVSRSAKRLIAINLACDMSEIRFSGFKSQAEFAREMASVISGLAEHDGDREFCLVPHIFRDLEIISQTISFLDDRLRRTRLSVAPYVCGDEGASQLLAIYQAAVLVMGMRFHANVCPLALGRNVIGLSCYPQIASLYRGLGLTDHFLDVCRPGFAASTLRLAESALANPSPFQAAAQLVGLRVQKRRSDFEKHLHAWLA